MNYKDELTEVTSKLLQNNLNEDYNDDVNLVIKEANNQLKHLNSSQELVDIVEDYLNDKDGNGFPIYLVSKKGGWMIYAGTVIDNDTAHFLVSDTVSTRIVNYKNAYKYYRFSNTYRG